MTDNPTNIELVERMIQACKNIIFATSGINSHEDVAKDVFAIENMETCLTIILESHVALSADNKQKLSTFYWDEIENFKKALSNTDKTTYDYKQLYRSCKEYIPKLLQKLESQIDNIN